VSGEGSSVRRTSGLRHAEEGVVRVPQKTENNGSAPGLAWARWTEEVRLAMAWNGGVSLAVWMGGVAVELDAAQRARRPSADLKADPAQTAEAARTTAQL
jgi:hypothetical protein